MKSKKIQYTVSEGDVGKRLDIFLSEQLEMSRSKVQQLIDDELVLANGKLPKKAGDMLKVGHTVEVLSLERKPKVQEEKTIIAVPRIRIVKETPDYLIVFKPAGVLTHPTEAGEPETLADQVLGQYPEIKGVGEGAERWGIVHRLDKEASGLLVVARTKKMFQHLKQQFQDRTVEKEYTVLVHGSIDAEHGTIDFAIDRGRDGSMAARPKVDPLTLKGAANLQPGKESLTEFSVKKRFARYTLLSVVIHTGRMHQIRVHMQAYNHPVVGDMLYFNKKLNRKRDVALGRLFLHAGRLCFLDIKNEKKCYEEPLPQDLEQFLVAL